MQLRCSPAKGIWLHCSVNSVLAVVPSQGFSTNVGSPNLLTSIRLMSPSRKL